MRAAVSRNGSQSVTRLLVSAALAILTPVMAMGAKPSCIWTTAIGLNPQRFKVGECIPAIPGAEMGPSARIPSSNLFMCPTGTSNTRLPLERGSGSLPIPPFFPMNQIPAHQDEYGTWSHGHELGRKCAGGMSQARSGIPFNYNVTNGLLNEQHRRRF